MRPNTQHTPREVCDAPWTFNITSYRHMATADIALAAQLRTVALLEHLNTKLDSLGVDGIHSLIRLAVQEHRKRDRLRKAKAAAKRRRTIAKKKAAKLRAA